MNFLDQYQPDGRPSWDNYFLGVALAVAARGDCMRDKVGAVLVENQTHRILSTGFNGSAPGGKSCLLGDCERCNSDAPSGSSYEGCLEAHAEWNCLDYAIRYFPIENFSRSTMYVTRAPCVICEPLLREERVGRVLWPTGYLDLSPLKMS